jgi:membrane dipeptidase
MKKILPITLATVLALFLIGFAGASYMTRQSYALTNTVVTPAPYTLDQSSKAFHDELFIADLHVDTFTHANTFMERKEYAHLDFPRAREGGLSLLTMAIATEVPLDMVRNPAAGVKRGKNLLAIKSVLNLEPVANWNSLYARGNWVIDNITTTVGNNPDELLLITHREDVDALVAEHQLEANPRIGILLAIEGAQLLEGELDRLNELYAKGVRMISLTHAFDNEYGGSSEGVEKYGITPAGKELLARISELGMIIDIAHNSPELVEDLLNNANTPVVYSHGGLQGMCDINRNLSDTALDQVQENGGLIAVGFWTRVLCGDQIEDVVASIRYVSDRIGIDHVALGSDFDGGVKTIFDATGLPLLTEALLDAGFSKAEISKLMGKNYARLLRSSLPAR